MNTKIRVALVVGRGQARNLPSNIATFQRYLGLVEAIVQSRDITLFTMDQRWVDGKIPINDQKLWMKIPKLRVIFEGTNVNLWLDSLLEEPDIIFLYETNLVYRYWVTMWAKRKRVPIVVDVRDWYSTKDVQTFRDKVSISTQNLLIFKPSKQIQGAIVVSSILQEQFSRKSIQTLRLPALMPSAGAKNLMPFDSEQVNPLVISFIGNAGSKDSKSVSELIYAANNWNNPEKKLEVHIVGPISPVGEPITEKPTINSSIVWHQTIPRNQAIEVLENSHFTTLIRPSERYSNSGFPSKVAESLLHGVPVIANLTSDLSEHLIKGFNFIELDNTEVGCLLNALNIYSKNSTVFNKLKISREADKVFSPKELTVQVTEFLFNVAKFKNTKK